MQAVDVDTREPVYAPLNIHLQPPGAAAAPQVATKPPRPSQVCGCLCTCRWGSNRVVWYDVWLVASGLLVPPLTYACSGLLQQPPLSPAKVHAPKGINTQRSIRSG